MNKLDFNRVSKGIRTTVIKHSPEILTGIGVAGMITAAVLAVQATPKALTLIEKKKTEIDTVTLTPLETIGATWPCYIPALITGVFSVLCLIGANSVHVRKNAALAAAYTLSESALKKYQDKVVETIGEKKEQAVRTAIAKDEMDRNPVNIREIIITETGNTLCYDVLSGRYFKSDIDKIKKAANEINRNLINDMYISLNDLYDAMGLSNTKLGELLGWNAANGLVDLTFSSLLAADGTPCLVIDYRVAPMYDYYR